MKIALVVRQLDRGHILWCGRVVRVERAHRIRIVRGVQKMLDVGRHGMIEFGHIRFVARDHVVIYVFREDEFVGYSVAHHSARDTESLGKVWRSRSQSPARVTQQRRQNRRIVWDDRARMGAAVICELEVSQLGYVRMRMGPVSSICSETIVPPPETWGFGDHNGLGGGDDIPVKDLLDRQRVHRVAVVGECEPAVNISHAERVGSDAPTRVGIAGRVVAGRYRRVMRAATRKTYCY
jgi:hypothetical protein